MITKEAVLKGLVDLKPRIHPRLYTWMWSAMWPLLREPDGFISKMCGDIEVRLDLREDAERAIFAGDYDPPLTAFFRHVLRPGDLVVDIGANVGALSVVAANAVGVDGSVVSIEPNPTLAKRLTGISERNPLGNIRVIEAAIGDEKGPAKFFVSSSHPYSSLDQSELPDYPLQGVVDVQVRTLDDVWATELNGRPIRLLKIDVQGFEAKVIRGGRRCLQESPPDLIVLELMGEGLSKVRQDLRAWGYAEAGLDAAGAMIVAASDLKPGENLVMYRPS